LALLIVATTAVALTLTQVANSWFATHAAVDGTSSASGFLQWASGPIAIESAVAIVIGIIAALLFFLVVNALMVRPLRLVRDALEKFAARGEHTPLPDLRGYPREVRDIVRVSDAFMASTEAVHARDAEMSRMKSDFISTAAHQLRTPLTGIRWSLEALEKEALTEDQKLLVKSAVDKSHDLVGIVGTLLDISSIESGKYTYHLAHTDMNELAESVVKDFNELATRSGVSLSFEAYPGLLAVHADQERMKWVLANLVENAIRYTPKGGSVRVFTESVRDSVVTRVRDTGIGIPKQDRNNIFERFYRAGNAVAQNNQGNGLGLYIARTAVKDHGGELSFEGNGEGPGTTFILSLPAIS
jgi:signal transduction histidine kinase